MRSGIIWNKPNCQPESVKDRLRRSHKYLFLLTKSERYFYNHEAVREPSAAGDTKNRRTVWSDKLPAGSWCAPQVLAP